MSFTIRMGLPSKGRLQEDCLEFFQACDMKVAQKNPRQYIASVSGIPEIEVWFQRPIDIVRQVRNGSLDLGLAGYDLLAEYGGTADQIVMVHDALGFSRCTLEVVVPETWTEVNTVEDLTRITKSWPQTHPGQNAIRVVSKYERVTRRFLEVNEITPYHLLHADGALEAAPQLGTADFIIDLVETGVTLRENHLKTLEGGRILESEACLFGNREMLSSNSQALAITRLILELFEAHIRANQHYNIIANMRGESAEAVAQKLHSQTELGGLQGPTISSVYPKDPGSNGWYAISLVVRKTHLQTAIQQLRSVGGSGVVVLPAIFIFEETPERWSRLQQALEL